MFGSNIYVGGERLLTFADMNHLSYVNCVIKFWNKCDGEYSSKLP